MSVDITTMNRHRSKTPWGRIAGTLTAVVVTLGGVAQSIDPIEILKRASTAFVVVALVTAALMAPFELSSRRKPRSVR